MKAFSSGGFKKSGFGGGNRGGFGGGASRGPSRGGFGGGNRGGFNGPREDREMFDATCNSCGSECQVPFRPNGRKPVLCTNCFRNEEGGNDRFERRNRESSFQAPKRSFEPRTYHSEPRNTPSDERLQSIEAKLDVILSQLRRIARENNKHEQEETEETATDFTPAE